MGGRKEGGSNELLYWVSRWVGGWVGGKTDLGNAFDDAVVGIGA